MTCGPNAGAGAEVAEWTADRILITKSCHPADTPRLRHQEVGVIRLQDKTAMADVKHLATRHRRKPVWD